MGKKELRGKGMLQVKEQPIPMFSGSRQASLVVLCLWEMLTTDAKEMTTVVLPPDVDELVQDSLWTIAAFEH